MSTAIQASSRASALGIKTTAQDIRPPGSQSLPQQLAVIGQGASSVTYSSDKRQVTSLAEVVSTYGAGSPLALAAAQLFPVNGDGVGAIPVTIYPLQDDGSGVAASGTVTPTGPATAAGIITFTASNVSVQVAIASGDTASAVITKIKNAIDAVPEMPVSAASVNSDADLELTAKWKGTSGNSIKISISGTVPGLDFSSIVQPANGAANPDITSALDDIGARWETMVLHCGDGTDGTTLDAIHTWGEGRWGALLHQPAIVFHGSVGTSVAAIDDPAQARPLDRTNALLTAPGSPDLPFVVAARLLARIVVVANDDPARAYGGQRATGITPGSDGVQWNYAQRDQAVKAGVSTTTLANSVVVIEDVVTFYQPENEQDPAYRYVRDVVVMQNVIYNLAQLLSQDRFRGAPLLEDDDHTTNPAAIKPKIIKAELSALADNLGDQALITRTDYTKANMVVSKDTQNPNRLNVIFPAIISGAIRIISVDLNTLQSFG